MAHPLIDHFWYIDLPAHPEEQSCPTKPSQPGCLLNKFCQRISNDALTT
jgi:hypothetical protein